jgi:heterodisulfide reductase subunit A
VIAQAKAGAGKAAIPLAKGFVEVPPIVADVNEAKCIGCAICAEVCPFTAIEMVKVDKRRKARVIKAACKGCGICASHCPVFAIDVGGSPEMPSLSN